MKANDKLRILIVEDRLLTVEQLSEIVKSGISRLTIAITASEEAAINHLRTTTPDLVVLDLSLKHGSAIGVLQAVKDLQPTATVAVLAAKDLSQTREQAIKLGADFVLDHATDGIALSGIVRSVAQQRQVDPDPSPERDAPGVEEQVSSAADDSPKRLH